MFLAAPAAALARGTKKAALWTTLKAICAVWSQQMWPNLIWFQYFPTGSSQSQEVLLCYVSHLSQRAKRAFLAPFLLADRSYCFIICRIFQKENLLVITFFSLIKARCEMYFFFYKLTCVSQCASSNNSLCSNADRVFIKHYSPTINASYFFL